MRLILRAGSIIRNGPERDLIDDYLKRASGLTQTCGFLDVTEQQVDLRKAKSREDETRILLENPPPGSKQIILDERGKALTSRKIAERFQTIRDEGHSHLILAIGGADGFEPKAIPQGVERWAFGVQTWPHKMVRVMLSEQIYRSLSIIAGTPYHRD